MQSRVYLYDLLVACLHHTQQPARPQVRDRQQEVAGVHLSGLAQGPNNYYESWEGSGFHNLELPLSGR